MLEDAPNPSNLVVVLETSDRIQAAMAKGLLDDAGIPLYMSGEIATLVQELDPFLHKKVCLQVPRNREGEARQILEQFHESVLEETDNEV